MLGVTYQSLTLSFSDTEHITGVSCWPVPLVTDETRGNQHQTRPFRQKINQNLRLRGTNPRTRSTSWSLPFQTPNLTQNSSSFNGSCWEPTHSDTVDGWNPAPVDMENIPKAIGFYTSQVVQDFFDQRSEILLILDGSSATMPGEKYEMDWHGPSNCNSQTVERA